MLSLSKQGKVPVALALFDPSSGSGLPMTLSTVVAADPSPAYGGLRMTIATTLYIIVHSSHFTLPIANFLLIATTIALAQPSNDNWDSRFGMPGVDGEVKAMAVSGNDVYIGGDFKHASNIPAGSIIRWNTITHHWYPLGDFPYGVNGQVYAIAVDGDNVYVGGQFSHAGYVESTNLAVYHPSTNTWSSLGAIGVLRDYVSAIAIHNGQVIIGGRFTIAGTTVLTNIARYDGSKWKRMQGGTLGPVSAIASMGSDIYVGGDFTIVDTITANNIARWNGQAWSAVGDGINGPVHALTTIGTNLYAGGTFTRAGTVATNNIVCWNASTTTWLALGSGVWDTDVTTTVSVNSIAMLGSRIYVGGWFLTVGIDTGKARHAAYWDGTEWKAMRDLSTDSCRGVASSPANQSAGYAVVNAVAVLDGEVYFGGTFDHGYMTTFKSDPHSDNVFNGYNAFNIIRWNPQDSLWRPLGDSPSGPISGLAINDNNLIVAGHFASAGGVPSSNIIGWNRASRAWNMLDKDIKGVFTTVGAVACNGNDIYVAIYALNPANRFPVNSRVARWDGSAWTMLGSAFLDLDITTIAVVGDVVYAGGIPEIGGPVQCLYQWDGSAWTPVGGGIIGSVAALAGDGNDLYVGGNFPMAGSVAANNIARWDGSAWSALGNGTDSVVDAIAIDQGSLYVGGLFTTAGSITANHVARWDIAKGTWQSLGSGTDTRVRALAARNGWLYAGGDFSSAGGNQASHIAAWNGETWEPLASGVNNTVTRIIATDDEIFAAGIFDIAGAWSSFHIARWSLGTVSVPTTPIPIFSNQVPRVVSTPNPFNSTTNIHFYLPTVSHVRLNIFDAMGRETVRLVDGPLSPGDHVIEWAPESLPFGMYFCRLEAGGSVVVTKIVRIEN